MLNHASHGVRSIVRRVFNPDGPFQILHIFSFSGCARATLTFRKLRPATSSPRHHSSSRAIRVSLSLSLFLTFILHPLLHSTSPAGNFNRPIHAANQTHCGQVCHDKSDLRGVELMTNDRRVSFETLCSAFLVRARGETRPIISRVKRRYRIRQP